MLTTHRPIINIIWFSEIPSGRYYVVNSREKFLPGPGFKPESTALGVGTLTN